MYARNTGLLPTFALEDSSELIAFVSLREHFPESWEIDCIAVTASHRNTGLGSRLLAHAEQWALSKGARYLQVKTLAPSAGDANYDQTRRASTHGVFRDHPLQDVLPISNRSRDFMFTPQLKRSVRSNHVTS